MIKKGDIVVFAEFQKINLEDYISLAKGKYSKFMIVIDIVCAKLTVKEDDPDKEYACRVMSASGEINWISSNRLVNVQSLDNF